MESPWRPHAPRVLLRFPRIPISRKEGMGREYENTGTQNKILGIQNLFLELVKTPNHWTGGGGAIPAKSCSKRPSDVAGHRTSYRSSLGTGIGDGDGVGDRQVRPEL